MKILKLEAENVKRLKAVAINPDGSVVTIRGRNGQGKSSCLDSIMYALGGKDLHPKEVIRRGEQRAQVVLDLGDLVVERRWTSNERSTVTVKSKEGAKYSSPQAMLDKLVGSLSFDPLTFLRKAPKEQVEVVRGLVGLDFSEQDAQRAKLYEERTLVNREVASLKASLDRLPPADGPAGPVSIAELLEEQRCLLEQKAENDKVRRAHADARAQWERATKDATAAHQKVADLERQLEEARAAAVKADEHLEAVIAAGKAAGAAAKELVEPDLDGIRARIAEAEKVNEQIRAAEQRRELAARFGEKEAESEALTKAIEQIDADKAATLAAAEFPVEGLGFTEDGLTLDGLPMEQASAAQQLRVSVAIAAASNPKLRVVLVRDGSLLDEDSLRLLGELAEKHDLQVWLEMVGPGDCGVVIEDGQVVGTEPPSEKPLPGFEVVNGGVA